MTFLLLFFGILAVAMMIINYLCFHVKSKFYIESYSEDKEYIYVSYAKLENPFYHVSRKIKKN